MSKAVNQLIAYFGAKGRLSLDQLTKLRDQGHRVPEELFSRATMAAYHHLIGRVNDRPLSRVERGETALVACGDQFTPVLDRAEHYAAGTLCFEYYGCSRGAFFFGFSPDGHCGAPADLRPVFCQANVVIARTGPYTGRVLNGTYWNIAPTPCLTLEEMRRITREMELMSNSALGVPWDASADE